MTPGLSESLIGQFITSNLFLTLLHQGHQDWNPQRLRAAIMADGQMVIELKWETQYDVIDSKSKTLKQIVKCRQSNSLLMIRVKFGQGSGVA